MAAHDWLGTTDASTIVAANYDPAAVPGTGDTLRFDGDGDNACTFAADMSLAGLTSLVGYTDKVDLATFDLTMDDGADITLDMAGEFDMGTGTISLTNGNFDYSAIGTLNDGTSTLSMAGVGVLTGDESANLFNLTIANSASVTVAASQTIVGDLVVNGTMSVATAKSVTTFLASSSISLGSAGAISGLGALQISTPGAGEGIVTLPSTATIDIATLTVTSPEAVAPLVAGTYESASTIIESNAAGKQFNFGPGDYTFTGNVIYGTTGGGDQLTVDNSANANITYGGDVTFTAVGDMPVYTAGTGTMMLSGLSNVQIDFGDNASENLTINKPTSGDVTLVDVDLVIDSIDMADDFIVPSGDVDTTESATLDIGGDVTLAGNAFDLGDLTVWTVGGDFDNAGVTSFVAGTSMLIMTGTATLTSSSSNDLRDLTIATAAVITSPASVDVEGLVVNGTWEIAAVAQTRFSGDLVFGPSGNVSGNGILGMNSPSGVDTVTLNGAGNMTGLAEFRIINPAAAWTGSISAGTYDADLTKVLGTVGTRGVTLLAGDYVFNAMEFECSGGTLTIANDTNNPSISLGGDLLFDEQAGTLTYTKGTGKNTLFGTGNQTLTCLDQATENLTINKPTAGDVTLVDVDLTIDSIDMADNFIVPSGDVDTTTSATLNIGGDMTLDGTFDMGDLTVWTVGGSFDNKDATFTRGTSTLVMTGTGDIVSSNTKDIANLTIAVGAAITLTTDVDTLLSTINGSLEVDAGGSDLKFNTGLTFGPSGVLSGVGRAAFNEPGSTGSITLNGDSNITIATLRILSPKNTATGTLSPGTYGAGKVEILGINANDQLQLSAGAYTFSGDLELEASAGDLTIDNATHDPSIELQGDLVWIETATLTYTAGTGAMLLSGLSNQNIELGDNASENLTINKPTSGDVTLVDVDLTIDSVTMAESLFVISGVVDTTDEATCSILGDMALDNDTFDMGLLTIWTVDAEFDNADVATFEPGTSTLVLTGASGAIRSAAGNELNAVTIATGALVTTLTDFGAETLAVNGTLQMGGDTVTFEDGLVFGAAGIIDGTSGTLVFNEPTGANAVVLAAAANIQVDVFQVLNPAPSAVPLPPGTYDTWLQIIGSQTGREMRFDSGTYNIIGRLEYETTAGALTINNAVNDPSFVIGGSGFSDLRFTPSGGSLVYTKGSGSYTLTESMAIESKGYDLEAIIVAAGTFTQSDDLDTVDGLTIQSGATWDCDGFDVVIANGGDLVVSGDMVGASLDAARFTVSGSATLRAVDTSGSTAEWFIDVTGSLTAYDSIIKNSNAGVSGGVAYNSTDGTGNTNWEFRELPVGSGNAGKSGAYWHRYGYM